MKKVLKLVAALIGAVILIAGCYVAYVFIDYHRIEDNLTLDVAALDPQHPVPSCRNCDIGYIPGQTFVITVDGFLVSDNVKVRSAAVRDLQFQYSDHNPVAMTFELRSPR